MSGLISFWKNTFSTFNPKEIKEIKDIKDIKDIEEKIEIEEIDGKDNIIISEIDNQTWSGKDSEHSKEKIIIKQGKKKNDIFNEQKSESSVNENLIERYSNNSKEYIPSYIKINLNPKEKYILTSPYPENTIFTKGDLVIKDDSNSDEIKINNNCFMAQDEIIILSDISEITISLLKEQNVIAKFYLEKYEEGNVHIIENYRNYDPFQVRFTDEECKNGIKKYILLYVHSLTKMCQTYCFYFPPYSFLDYKFIIINKFILFIEK